ncbi:MAG: DUF4375 domain-containing protein [Bryobacteraceae bacterium]|nr:DUF4375 domain-containing protein [Bryobacteraceae bacterium]
MPNIEFLQPIADRVIVECLASGLARLEPQDRIFYLIWSHGALLENGGHSSFFYNSGADHYLETIAALEDLGLRAYAEFLRRVAAMLFDGDVPRDITARNEIIVGSHKDNLGQEDEIESIDREFSRLGGWDTSLDALEEWYRSPEKRNARRA